MTLADFSNQRVVLGSAEDLAEALGPDGIRTLLSIICEAYAELHNSGRVTSNWLEIAITEELYVELLKVWKKYKDCSIYPIHEKAHNKKQKGPGKPPTIDFCFRDEWVRDSYFGAECKLLKENDKSLYEGYINGGICRYLSGKYGELCSCGSMIGYIILGNPVQVVKEVKNRVDEVSDVSKMQKSYSIKEFTEHYESEHKRSIGRSPFCIHHLFFSFT